jgi:hypothetical protein
VLPQDEWTADEIQLLYRIEGVVLDLNMRREVCLVRGLGCEPS